MAKLEFGQPPESDGEAWKELPVRGVWVNAEGKVWLGIPSMRRAGMVTLSEAKGGYLNACIPGVNGGKPVGVHRLVAHAFHGDCPDGMCVDHIDCDPSNNRPENLQYVTPSENTRLYWQRRKELGPVGWLIQSHRRRMRQAERLLLESVESSYRRQALIAQATEELAAMKEEP